MTISARASNAVCPKLTERITPNNIFYKDKEVIKVITTHKMYNNQTSWCGVRCGVLIHGLVPSFVSIETIFRGHVYTSLQTSQIKTDVPRASIISCTGRNEGRSHV